MLPTKFRFIWPSGFQGKDFFRNQPIRNKNCVAAMSVNGSGRNEQSLQRTAHRCFLPSFGSFGQTVSEKNFLNWPIRNKSCQWQPCLSLDWDEMSKFYKGPSIDPSYQVSVHLTKGFQRRRFFLNQPIRNKNCLCWPCLLMDRDKMCNLQKDLL